MLQRNIKRTGPHITMGDYNQKPTTESESFGIVEIDQQMVDRNTKLVCPYDLAHVIRAKIFPYHLMKCRKNHPSTEMVQCPFNARHSIRRPERGHHMLNCPDKRNIEPDHEYNTNRKYNPVYQGNVSVPKYIIDKDVPNTSESWDDETESGMSQYSYPPPRNPNGMLNQQRSYQMAAKSNGHKRLQEEQPSHRQPHSQPAAMVAPPPQQSLQSPAVGQGTGLSSASAPTWSHIAGIGRGIPERADDFPLKGQTPTGIRCGIVKTPPGFGRGRHGQRVGPPIAANIYGTQ